MRPWVRYILAFTLVLCGQPSEAQTRSSIEVELAPGIAIPLTDYLVTHGETIEQNVQSKTGMGTELNLVLDNFEFRYSQSFLPSSELRIEVTQDFSDNVNASAENLNQQVGFDLIPYQPAGTSVRSGEPISIHHVSFGYRFPLLQEPFRIYLPLGIGLAMTTGSVEMLSRTLYGVGANTGLGFQVTVTQWVRLGLCSRYLYTISESVGDIFLFDTVANFGVTNSALATTFHQGHVVHITATASVYF